MLAQERLAVFWAEMGNVAIVLVSIALIFSPFCRLVLMRIISLIDLTPSVCPSSSLCFHVELKSIFFCLETGLKEGGGQH